MKPAQTVPPIIPTSPDAKPAGEIDTPYEPVEAGIMFADICLLRYPNTAEALDTMWTPGLTQNSSTGVYCHNRANICFSIDPHEWWLEYGTDVPAEDVLAGLHEGIEIAVGPTPPYVGITSKQRSDGLTYYRLSRPTDASAFDF